MGRGRSHQREQLLTFSDQRAEILMCEGVYENRTSPAAAIDRCFLNELDCPDYGKTSRRRNSSSYFSE